MEESLHSKEQKSQESIDIESHTSNVEQSNRNVFVNKSFILCLIWLLLNIASLLVGFLGNEELHPWNMVYCEENSRTYCHSLVSNFGIIVFFLIGFYFYIFFKYCVDSNGDVDSPCCMWVSICVGMMLFMFVLYSQYSTFIYFTGNWGSKFQCGAAYFCEIMTFVNIPLVLLSRILWYYLNQGCRTPPPANSTQTDLSA